MMRALMLIAVLSAAGCSTSPEALGITGPGNPRPAQPAPDLAPVGVPADTGNNYGPSIGPIPSNGPYFNYN